MSLTVVATGFGGPEVLSVVDEPVDPPAPGQVLLDVRAAGVNPADVKMYNGDFGKDPDKLPIRLGFEASGVVTQVGDGAVGPAGAVLVGDEVIAFRVSGAYAERLVVPASAVLPRPATLDFEQAAGLMLTGVTAVHLVTATGVGPGDTVLVHGASGGVGLMAVQIALSRGARVVGTASQARHAFLRDLGAEAVAYGPGLADRIRAVAPGGIDAAVDTAGTDEAVDVSVELVADRARIATIAAFGRGAQAGIQLLGGGPGADPGTEIRNAARLELVRLAEAGQLNVVVAQSFPLVDVAAAHRAVSDGHTHGKIVLVP